jgi:hypothetical protein
VVATYLVDGHTLIIDAALDNCHVWNLASGEELRVFYRSGPLALPTARGSSPRWGPRWWSGAAEATAPRDPARRQM